MCQIIVADKGVEIPDELLVSESRTNDDGWGVMAVNRRGTKIAVARGLDHGKLPKVVKNYGTDRVRAVHVRSRS